jgi:cobalt/nickel transport system permease protein
VTPGFQELGTLETLAAGASPVHRLDPRAKLVATAGFLVAVASFGRYEVAALMPYAAFPAALSILGRVPSAFLLRRLGAALPFVLLVGGPNAFLDHAPMGTLGPLALTGGWISLASLLLRFALMVSAALVLGATTRLDGVCLGLERLGLPPAFTRQVAFLHRYAFVLGGETARVAQAWSLRAFGRKPAPREFASMAGHLLLRAWDRARRIHAAMLSRGFDGHLPSRSMGTFGRRDLAFTLGSLALFAALRAFDLPHALGALLTGGTP